MLYPKNKESQLSRDLFRSPTSEYRAAPFWAWNCELEKDELLRQMDIFREMGFGGAHMHVRTGMGTTYLSDEHMALIKACTDKAKADGMRSYLYDEDRWPSGAAGGYVTKEKRFRARHLCFAPAGTDPDGEGTILARYDIGLDPNGNLSSYARLKEGETAAHAEWNAWLVLATESGWYNNQTYADTLNPEAIRKFIDITYEAYDKAIHDDLGTTVPSIFTDEPQFTRKSTLRFATDEKCVDLPWTDDVPDTFAKVYGEDIMEGLPELFWDRADGSVSLLRYHYHDHICERFASAFADQCGAWCRAHGIALTGHMMNEPTLESQTNSLGEAMRNYRGFDVPGIDMLCNYYEYTTAKQCQSAVHQFGYEGMLSELDGVTNWDFDFRGHKRHGDWQAALGVTLRVPHLSWVSMAGEAKRDYPASISYQSPWWKQYHRIEDHFARVNTAMTRGTPVVKIGVIHPIESYWLHWGPSEQTALRRDEMERNFESVTEWLLFGGIDFDLISESLLPEQCPTAGVPLKVGKMEYDAILVPSCETLRATTLERLEAFAKAGGKLIFAGEIPSLTDAIPSTRAAELAKASTCVSFSRGAILSVLEENRTVELRDESGALTDDLLYQLRQDGDSRWLFIAHGKEPYNKDISRKHTLRIRVKELFGAEIWDTISGTVKPAPAVRKNGMTELTCELYDYDSLLIRYFPSEAEAEPICGDRKDETFSVLAIPARFAYTLSEPNALLLDRAEWALNDGAWQKEEEILRLDNLCRIAKGWPLRSNDVAQPWVVPKGTPTDTIRLRFTIRSEIALSGVRLAIEDLERLEISLNGEKVPAVADGWYTDRSIRTVALPQIREGINTLEVIVPFGRRTDTEWAYLLGGFGVRVEAGTATLIKKPETIAFGDITKQGFPFYGGNITYHVPVRTNGGDLTVRSSRYRGALQTASLDGGEETDLTYPPYICRFGDLAAGEHRLDLTLYGHRRNSFGPVHLTDLNDRWIGPNAWRSEGERWTYDYMICEEGFLTTPVLTESEN